jgi:hypothetical protein
LGIVVQLLGEALERREGEERYEDAPAIFDNLRDQVEIGFET